MFGDFLNTSVYDELGETVLGVTFKILMAAVRMSGHSVLLGI